MLAAEVEVAFWRYVGDVCSYPQLFAELPHLCRCRRVVYGAHDHIYVLQVGRLKVAIDVCYLFLLNAVGDFVVQAVCRAYYCDVGIGVEAFENSSSGDLMLV